MDFKEIREEIEAAVSIGAIAGSRSGRIKCPFHNSSAPDMKLDHATNRWRCYGKCNAGGNIFDWVMRDQGVDFKEAMRFLADYAGIPLSPPKERTEILVKAQRFYHDALLANEAALNYLRRRGFSDAHIFERQFGYADPNDFPTDVPVRDLAKVGLIKAGYHSPYPTFRDRIVYPVYDRRFNQIQMQGRTVNPHVPKDEDDAGPPKYMALDSEVELKGRTIYQCLGGEEILRGKLDHVWLCEGFPDRETLTAWRLPAVCLFGHSGIERHAPRLQNVQKVYVVLDPDEASQSTLLHQLYQLAIKIPQVQFYNVRLATNGLDLNDWAMAGKGKGQYLSATADADKITALYQMAASAKPLVQDLIDAWVGLDHMIQPLVQLIARSPDPDFWVHNLATRLGEHPNAIRFLMRVLGSQEMF